MPNTKTNIYHHSARLSLALGVISNVAAFIFAIVAELTRPPGLPHPVAPLAAGLGIISAFAFFTGRGTAVIGWIDPASSRRAKWGFLWSLTPIFTGLISSGLTAWLLRLGNSGS